MKNVKWDCNLTMKFVKLYLSKRCLWDRNNLHYKYSKSKLKALQEIAHEMKNHIDIDEAGVKAKIRCLRSTYTQEVSKICRRSTDPDNIYEPSLPWFKEMDKCLKRNSAFYTQRPENKWGEQGDKNNYPEEHLDEQLLESSDEVGEITGNEPQEEDSQSPDIAYTDAIRSKWSSGVTVEFVKCYLKHECLWNPKDPDRSNKKVKLNAYKDIICTMNRYVKMDIIGIKSKVRNLRSTYNQELLKVMRKSKDPNHIYEPALSWFKLMDDKLKNVVQLRSKLITTDAQWDREWDHHKTNDETSIDEELLRNIKTDVEDINDDGMNDECNDEDSYGMNDEDNDDQMEHEESNKDILFIEPPSSKDGLLFEDEYDIFGKYVAAQLRRLELKPALQAKADILNILSKARIDALDT